MRSARSTFVHGVARLKTYTDRGLRRDLRDHAAMRLLVAATVRPGDCTVDIGANHGDVLGELLRAAPDGHHIAYEPVPALAGELRARFPSADVRERALADTAGSATFEWVVDADGHSGLRRRRLPAGTRVEQIPVTVARLDDDLPPGARPTFIKIDVEGAEYQVLLGGMETLRRHSPVLAFECGLGAADFYGTTPEMVHDLLSECGYRIFDLAGDGPYDRELFVRTFYRQTRQPIWNWMATR